MITDRTNPTRNLVDKSIFFDGKVQLLNQSKTCILALLTDIVTKNTIFGVVMLSSIYFPFALGLNIIKYVLYVHSLS